MFWPLLAALDKVIIFEFLKIMARSITIIKFLKYLKILVAFDKTMIFERPKIKAYSIKIKILDYTTKL